MLARPEYKPTDDGEPIGATSIATGVGSGTTTPSVAEGGCKLGVEAAAYRAVRCARRRDSATVVRIGGGAGKRAYWLSMTKCEAPVQTGFEMEQAR